MFIRLPWSAVLAIFCYAHSYKTQQTVESVGTVFIPEGSNVKQTLCITLEENFWDLASSFETSYPCVKIFDQENCSGNFIKLKRRSPYHNLLIMWQFDDRARSVGLCDETCVPNEDTSEPWNSTIPINVTFFQKVQFGGQSFSLQVRECTQIQKWPYLDASIRIPQDGCVLIFLKHSRTARDVSDCSTQDWDNVIEIRDGVPALNDLKKHILNTEFLGYISPCYCKLNPNPNPPTFTYIRLFSGTPFERNSIQIFLNFSGCKDFAKDAVLEKWEGVAESISVSYGGCVKAFKERNCEDMSGGKELITPFVGLDVVELLAEIRSLKLCSAEDNPEEERIPISDTKIPNTRILIYLIIIGGISILTGTSLVVAALYLQRRAKQIKKSLSNLLSNREVNEFLYGLPLEGKDEENKNIRNVIDQESQNDSLQFSYESQAKNKPYDYQLEIKRDQLHFDNKHPIGSGQFGLVYKGVMTAEDTAVDVAIKTAKPLSGAESLRTLMREVKVMMYAGHHPTIVNLMGCCTASLQEGYLFIVMEYCNNGSLGNYLMTNQHNFVNSLKTDTIYSNVTFVKNDHITTDYVKQLSFPQSSPCNLEEMKRFDSHQLIVWSQNIADGMDYLANKNVIHGDLSARNILLTTNKSVKISDFGLAHKLYSYSEYIRNGEEALPWRWMALESLKEMEFSTASDVWSYGILLWEIFSLGQTPFFEIPFWSTDFIENLEDGLRPHKPNNSTLEIYNIMLRCWNEEPHRRPTFSWLYSSFLNLTVDRY